MNQTAVEWLVDYFINLETYPYKTIQELIKQAKEMEEQQRDEFAIAFAEYVLDWNRDTTSDYLQIILEQFKNK
jgi:hypothetical protein